MSRIDELIAHHKARMNGAADEVRRIEKLPEGKHTTHDDHDNWIEGWEDVRRCCRDTISYLEAFKKHGVQP